MATDNESLSEMSQYYQCHQEELQKLLNILNPNASNLLDETDALEEDEKSMDMTRQSSITSYAGSVSIYHDDDPHRRSLRHLSEDQTDLNRLLNKDSDDSDSSGPLEKLKKIKTNFFTKRFSKRSKRPSIDKQDDSISLRSNTSDISRISLVDIKNELIKLKRIKKPKFRKPFVNKEEEGEGMASILARSIIHVQSGLACIAETQDSEASPGSTLRRISESEPPINISDDEIAKAHNEVEIISDDVTKMPEIRFTSLGNINSEEAVPEKLGRERKISESCPATPMPERSENLLALPGDVGYFGSVSSALSAESSELDSSSDEEDDESSDVRTDTERSYETTSSVVQTVLSHSLDPSFIAHIDKTFSILETDCLDLNEIKQQDIQKEIDRKTEVEQQVFDNLILIDKCKSLESVPREIESKIVKEKPVKSNEVSASSVTDETCVTKPSSSSSHHIKFHNPFTYKKAAKSFSEPSSPVEKGSFIHRSSRRIKRQLSKISKSNMIKSISHISLHPRKKETKTPLSQPGSSSDVHHLHSKAPSETVLGSPFLSYNDLMSLDKESIDTNKFFHKSDEFDRVKVSMYIGSEPVSRASLSGTSFSYHKEEGHDKKPSLKSTGLVHTAMETILLDKVQSMLMPASPDPDSAKNKQFFDDVNEQLSKVEEYRNKNSESAGSNVHHTSSTRPNSQSPPVNNKPVIVSGIRKTDKAHETKYKNKPHSLVQTAMETMLMDRVQSVLMPTTPETPKPELIFHDIAESHEECKTKINKPIAFIPSLLGPKSPGATKTTEKFFDSKPKKPEVKASGLIHTAMETMLMEKVQSVLGPETPQPTFTSAFDDIDRSEELKKKDDKPIGLVQTAVQTMLLEKVQASALGGIVPDPVLEIREGHLQKSDESNRSETSTGLTHTAMETILMDQVHSLLGHPGGMTYVEPNILCDDESEKHKKSSENDLIPTGLIHTAVETILLERVQASLGTPVVPDPIIPTEDVHKHDELNKEEVSGLTHTAVETILRDKVHSLVGQPNMTFVEPKTFSNDELDEAEHLNEDLKSPRLVQTAVQTILLDKVQSLIPTEGKHQLEKTENDKLGLIDTAIETLHMDKTVLPTQSGVTEEDKITTKTMEKSKSIPEPRKNNKRLTRQDSVDTVTDNETPKMSKKINTSSSDVTESPVLLSHSIIRGLETIPSLPETSVELVDETNNSVCDNSHAVCGANRGERERDRREDKCDKDRGSPRHARHESYGGREPVQTAHAQNSSLNATSTPLGIHRRSSDSDLSVTPKG